MANFFGIDYASGSEVQDEMTGTFESLKAQAAGDPLKLAAVSQQQAMFNLLGSPGLRQAKQRDKVVSDVLSNTQQNPEEDELDYQMRVAKQLRTAAAKAEPTLSLAANERILKLQTAQKERDKLKWQETIDKDDFDKSRTLVLSLNRADGSRIPIKQFPPNTPLDIINAEREKLQKGLGAGSEDVYDIVNFESAYGSESPVGADARRKRAGKSDSGFGLEGFNKSETKDLRTSIRDASVAVDEASFIMRDLAESPFATLQKLNDGIVGLANITESALEGYNRYILGETGKELTPEERASLAQEDTDLINKSFKGVVAIKETLPKGLQLMLADSAKAEQVRSGMGAMAYQLAKLFDPNGRLSNQDVDMAKGILMGTIGNPQMLVETIKRRLSLSRKGLTTAIEYAKAGRLEGYEGATEQRNAALRYEAGIQKFAEDAFRTVEAIKKAGVGGSARQDPEAIGNSALQTPATPAAKQASTPAGSGAIQFTVTRAAQ